MTTPLEAAQLAPWQMRANLAEFILNIQKLIDILHLDLHAYQMDHIALRINESELATAAHQAWLSEGVEISNAQINGRPIIVLAFHQPLNSGIGPIECLELPYPAQGKSYPQQGWEHVEFVVPSEATDASLYLQDLLARFPAFAAHWDELEARGVEVKLSSPKGEGERLANPTVAFKYQGVCVKLHPHPLKAIIASEAA